MTGFRKEDEVGIVKATSNLTDCTYIGKAMSIPVVSLGWSLGGLIPVPQ